MSDYQFRPDSQMIPPERVEETVRADEAALAAARGGEERLIALLNLSSSLHRRHLENGAGEDLDRAIDLMREARRLIPRSEDAGMTAMSLGVLLFRRRRPGDLAEGRTLVAGAVAGLAPGSVEYALARGTLGALAFAEYETGGGRDRLEEAITHLREALRLLPAGIPVRPTYRLNLGMALCCRFRDFDSPEADLDEGIALLEQVERELAASPPGILAANLPVTLRANLIEALRVRYALRRDPADERRVRELAEEPRAATETHASHARPHVLSAEAALALRRYEETGTLYDLDRAVLAGRAALDSLTPGDSRRPVHLYNVGFLHYHRHEALLRSDRPRALGELDSALDLTRQAHDAAPSPTARGLLGRCLLALHNTDHAAYPGVLDQAVEHLRHALDAAGDDPGTRDNLRPLLADALTARGLRDGSLADFDAADRVREALVRERPDSAAPAGGLAVMRVMRASVAQDARKLRAARDELRAALRALADRAPKDAFDLAWVWGETEWETCRNAAGKGASGIAPGEFFTDPERAYRSGMAGAADAYRRATESLHRLVGAQLLREHKEWTITSATDASGRGAFALSRSGDPEDLRQAVVTLEAGRALMLSESLERGRTGLDGLGDSGLAAEYRAAADRLSDLERAELGRSPGPDTTAPRERPDARVRALEDARRDWALVVERIRAVPGYRDFLRAPTFDTLAAVVRRAGCPVVYLSATDLGGVALLLTPDAPASVVRVDLPLLDRAWERRVAADWLRAAETEPEDEEDIERAEQACDALSRELWTRVMEPVTAALRGHREAVLIPTGGLALVPLHAAGWNDPQAPTGRRHVLDRLAVRYAPTLRSLAVSLDRCQDLPDDTSRVLAVADPAPVDREPLPDAEDEVAAVCCWFAGRIAGVLAGPAADRDRVAGLLTEAEVHHFACHADFDPARPLDGGLVMARDERITARDLLAAPGFRSRLVTLSACRTGMVGDALPDEAVSLATAVLQAGAAGVVASLWEVPSAATMALMARFYEHWRRERLPVAEALRRAQLWFRDATNAEKHAALPMAPAFAPPPDLDPAGRAQWPDQRQDASPLAWSAFFHTGG
ncbi:CHAT domain-containing protein [Streptomyces specialis]|uniref:CHAT domain-containing protein n=1 Tax=Streptomyces specialis TaxID=498367 RepID=UPI00073EB96B|nr:CHAT domain-containing protein [Streptomyces specialis]